MGNAADSNIRADTEPSAALLVTENSEDIRFFQRTFRSWKWQIHTAATCRDAGALLRREPVAVIITEAHLADGSWKDLRARADLIPDPPLVIVTSLNADDQLWAEVLNEGGYDVLAKPFEQPEVIRVVSLAWLHWRHKHQEIHRSATSASNIRTPASGVTPPARLRWTSR